MRAFLLAPFLSWSRRLKQPTLLLIAGALFLITLVIPDPIPLLDEILLGLVTLGLANWTSKRASESPAPAHADRVIDGQARRMPR